MAGKPLLTSNLSNTCRVLSKQQCRTLSSSVRLQRSGGASMGGFNGALLGQMREQRSMQSRMQNAKNGEIQDDLGLMPNTFIKPPRQDRPGLLSAKWKRRLQMEWLAYKQKVLDFILLVYTTRFAQKKDPLTKKRERLPMYLAHRESMMKTLQVDLYRAFAYGDRDKIQQIACAGLRKQLLGKLDHRRAAGKHQLGMQLEYLGLPLYPSWNAKLPEGASLWRRARGPLLWFAHLFIPPRWKSCQIIYDRIGPIPIGTQSYLRQVVGRLRSNQTLNANVAALPVVKKNHYDYVVIQKVWLNGEEMPWKIWGTTQPTDDATLDKLLKASSSGESFLQKVKDRMMGTMSGGSGSASSMM